MNPLLKESTLPYSAPDFDRISSKDYKEAIEKGMQIQSENIQTIVNNTEEPNFDNTILALEKSNAVLESVLNIFFAVTEANTDETIENTQEEMLPRLSVHNDSIYLNENLFKRVENVYTNIKKFNLDKESEKLVRYYYDNFILSGAKLSNSDKEKLKEINKNIANLQNKFKQNVLKATNAGAMVVKDEKELKGLTAEEINNYREADKSIKIPLINTTQQPVTAFLDNKDVRERIFNNSWNRGQQGEFENLSVIKELIDLRTEKALLLGYKNYAEWSLQHSMVKTPENAFHFMEQLIPSIVKKVNAEAKDIENLMKASGDNRAVAPYDWSYYAEKVRKAKYDLDEKEIKAYFVLDSVLEKGVFYAATELYGITFKKRTDIPVYHPDVVVYEVFEANGDGLGLFYGDFYARESKRGGAWMSNFVTQSELYNKKPVIYNVCNYAKPAKGGAALISYDDVSTLFHEFGHALHGFFANQRYPSLSGTAVARDFVEFPSQFNENWALHPKVLKNYAHHYQTGAEIPEQLLQKIKKAATFNQGFSFSEAVSAAYMDMKWHSIEKLGQVTDVDGFEREAIQKFPHQLVPPRYRSPFFSHIFGGGYAAGYYSYSYTNMLNHDTYSWFEENGGLTRENGQRFRDMILSKGNTEDYEQMYVKFRGKQPSIEPLLRSAGF